METNNKAIYVYLYIIILLHPMLSNANLRLALDNIGWSRTEGKTCFPMSLTSSSFSRDRNKYGRILFMLQTKRNNR